MIYALFPPIRQAKSANVHAFRMYAKVVGVLEVQQEAQLIERLWEGVGQPDDTVTGEGAAQVLLYWITNDDFIEMRTIGFLTIIFDFYDAALRCWRGL